MSHGRCLLSDKGRKCAWLCGDERQIICWWTDPLTDGGVTWRKGGREIQFKNRYLMGEELGALLKEQFQKFNIQFRILPHISDGTAQPHYPC